MTDDVAALVLRDNYQQSAGDLRRRGARAGELDRQARFMRALERNGRLDRAVEFLPDDDACAERPARARV